MLPAHWTMKYNEVEGNNEECNIEEHLESPMTLSTLTRPFQSPSGSKTIKQRTPRQSIMYAYYIALG